MNCVNVTLETDEGWTPTTQTQPSSIRHWGFLLQQPSNQLQPRYSPLNEVYRTSDLPTQTLPQKHAHPFLSPASALLLRCFNCVWTDTRWDSAAAFLIRSRLKSSSPELLEVMKLESARGCSSAGQHKILENGKRQFWGAKLTQEEETSPTNRSSRISF